MNCIKDERFLSWFYKQYLEVKLDNTGEIVDVKLVCKVFKNHEGWKVYEYEYKGEYYFIILLQSVTMMTWVRVLVWLELRLFTTQFSDKVKRMKIKEILRRICHFSTNLPTI